MSATNSKLPKRLAILGVAIPVALVVVWWYINAYDPFHLRALYEAHRTTGYAEPVGLKFFEDMNFVLCPPIFPLGFAAMDMSTAGQLTAWAIAAALNGLLYYWFGRGIVVLMDRVRRAR